MPIERGDFALMFLKSADGTYQQISVDLTSVATLFSPRDLENTMISCEGYIKERKSVIEPRELEKEWEEKILAGIKKTNN